MALARPRAPHPPVGVSPAEGNAQPGPTDRCVSTQHPMGPGHQPTSDTTGLGAASEPRRRPSHVTHQRELQLSFLESHTELRHILLTRVCPYDSRAAAQRDKEGKVCGRGVELPRPPGAARSPGVLHPRGSQNPVH